MDSQQKLVDDLKKQQKMLADSVNQLALEKEEAQKAAEEAKNTLLDLQFNISEQLKKLDEIKSGVEAGKLESAAFEVESRNKNAKHGEAIALLEGKVQSLNREATLLEQSNKEIDNVLVVKRRELQALEDNLIKSHNQAVADRSAWEVTVDGLKQTVSALSAEATEKKEQLSNLDREISNKREVFNGIDSNTASRLKELHGLEEKIKDSLLTLKEVEGEIKLRERDVSDVKIKVAVIKEELETLAKEKFNILEQKKSLDQREVRIRKAYSDAGVIYPE